MSVTTEIKIVLPGDVGPEIAGRQAQDYCVTFGLILVDYYVAYDRRSNQTIVSAKVAKQ